MEGNTQPLSQEINCIVSVVISQSTEVPLLLLSSLNMQKRCSTLGEMLLWRKDCDVSKGKAAGPYWSALNEPSLNTSQLNMELPQCFGTSLVSVWEKCACLLIVLTGLVMLMHLCRCCWACSVFPVLLTPGNCALLSHALELPYSNRKGKEPPGNPTYLSRNKRRFGRTTHRKCSQETSKRIDSTREDTYQTTGHWGGWSGQSSMKGGSHSFININECRG